MQHAIRFIVLGTALCAALLLAYTLHSLYTRIGTALSTATQKVHQ